MLLTPLRESQTEAVERALPFDGFLFLHEQRVGKTLTAIAMVDARKPRALLIACPLAAIRVWDEQLTEHLRADWPCELKIFNFEALRNRATAKRVRKWLKSVGYENCMIIIDEIHRIKRRGSKASRTLRQVSHKYCRYRIGLTGTPLGQGLEDGWAQMDLVDPSVYGTWDEFSDQYLRYGGFKGYKIIGYKRELAFKRLWHSRCYRITLQEARATKYKVLNRRVLFDLTPRNRKIYNDLEKGLTVEVNKRKIKQKLVMQSVMKCQQLTGGYLIHTDEDTLETEVLHVGNEKIDWLEEIIDDHPDEKLVIIARFVHELEAIGQMLHRRGLSFKRVSGGKDPAGNPYKFDGKFNVDVIILQIQSGIAVDMSASSIAIFYSCDYSFFTNAQVKFRILSFEKTFVTYYYLIARETVDEDLYESVKRKRKLSDVVCDHYRHRN
jgi:superfamily II DNA or RNA helicase